MGKLSDLRFLEASAADADSLLGGPLHPLERLGLERHRQALTNEISRTQAPSAAARALVYFDGPPVSRGGGIEAKFAADALESYQDLVAKLAALRMQGTIEATGPIPGLERSKFHITNVVRGSFGFELEEMNDSPELFRFTSPLAEAVEDASALIAAAVESDDAFLEAAPEQGAERINLALRRFLGTLSAAGASMRLVTQRRSATVPHQAVVDAVERVIGTEIRVEEAKEMPGTFLGVLLHSGRFEHQCEDGTTVSGRASRDLDLHSLVPITDKPATAVVQVETLRRGTRERRKYTLLRLSPLIT